MAVCMYPVVSVNYSLEDFGVLIREEIECWSNKGSVPFVGGDFYSRLGNINVTAEIYLDHKKRI